MGEAGIPSRPLYERPQLTEVGSVKDLTLGEGIFGRDDTFVFTIWGRQITINYGELS